jgi:hypothetical protein
MTKFASISRGVLLIRISVIVMIMAICKRRDFLSKVCTTFMASEERRVLIPWVLDRSLRMGHVLFMRAASRAFNLTLTILFLYGFNNIRGFNQPIRLKLKCILKF